MNTNRVPDARPCLHHASAIRADATLASTITSFVNEGYRYMSPKSALRWDSVYGDRLRNPDSIHTTLGDDGMFAVIYDPQNSTIPIACAATKRWKHDLEGMNEPGEDGWEIVTVTTRVDWMRRGLAGQCVDALVEEVVRQARRDETCDAGSKVNIWIHTVEDLNGAYWRKKGWVEVRSYDKPIGHWGSKFGYRLLVLLQKFEVS
jgi:GNAT superfamily N-acetyltransferase